MLDVIVVVVVLLYTEVFDKGVVDFSSSAHFVEFVIDLLVCNRFRLLK